MPAQLMLPSSVSGSWQSGQVAGEFRKPHSKDCPRWGHGVWGGAGEVVQRDIEAASLGH